MTVIVGALCKNGIVIGADSSATSAAPLSNSSIPTVEAKTKKVEILCNNVIYSGTGSVGLSQRFAHVVSTYFNSGNNNGKTHLQISQEIHRLTQADFAQTGKGFQHREFGAALGFTVADKFYLCEFPVQDFQPEFKSEALWYVSMGSGQLIADPFLGFVRKNFWMDKQPTLEDGIFGTFWTLEHAIELNPGGIGPPSQIAILKQNADGSFVTEILGDEVMQEHIENLKALETHIKAYKGTLSR